MAEVTTRLKRRSRRAKMEVVTLSKLEQTEDVVALREAANRWPLVALGNFMWQASSDAELNVAIEAMTDAQRVALQVAAIREPESAEALKALGTLSAARGNGDAGVLQPFSEAIFSLGVLYGLRLSGGVR